MTSEAKLTCSGRQSTAIRTLSQVKTRVGRVVFGDRYGLFVFLASLTLMMVLWRFQVMINDNITLVNGLAALADGHLVVTDPAYGETLVTPGMVTADGQAYPRNIGQLVIALPILWLMQLLTMVMDLRVAIAATWSLGILGTVATGGRLLGRPAAGHLLGSGMALAAFVASLLTVAPTQVEHYALPALQLSTLLIAAFLCVLLYRICYRCYDHRVGLAAGLATGLATSTLLWASIPKRHVPVAALVITSLYFLYRSRTADEIASYRRFRLLAYVPVGLSAWIFIIPGVTLLIALAIADLLSARENGLRSIAGITVAGLIGALPFFLTNYLIAGDPLTSPMTLPPYEASAATSPDGSTGGGPAPPARGATESSALPVAVQQALAFLAQYQDGLEVIITDPGRLNPIFLRSGWFDALADKNGLVINLSVTESMPLIGALLGAPILIAKRLRVQVFKPIHALDTFVIAYSVLTIIFYLPGLPLHAQVTVRYFFALYPLAIYALIRLPWVREVIQTQPRLLTWTYLGGVLLGGQLLLASLILIDAGFQEGTQAIALLGLGLAGLTAVWSVASATGTDRPTVGAVVLGLAASCATNLYLILMLYYFGAHFALPIIPTL